jgi:hypothetical protein
VLDVVRDAVGVIVVERRSVDAEDDVVDDRAPRRIRPFR